MRATNAGPWRKGVGAISLILAVGAAVACGAAPETDVQRVAETADPPHDHAGATTDLHQDGVVGIGPTCSSSACAAACEAQPGVAGGYCSANLCICDAPTCGQFLQLPCTGDYCAPPLHYSAAWGLCNECGNLGEGCCSTQTTSNVTACYGGTQCIDTTCQACGGVNQPLCPNGTNGCNPGLVVALAPGAEQWSDEYDVGVCASACGLVGQLPCWEYFTDQSGCIQLDAERLPDSPDCQWNPNCGHLGQGCCDAGSYFQTPDYETDLCHDGSVCAYEGTAGFGSWQCVKPSSGGGGAGGCEDSCDPCDPIECTPCFSCDSGDLRTAPPHPAR